MSECLRCWNCGADLAALLLPFGRLDECPSCTRQVHVCRMCRHYDPAVSKKCREDDAEEVRAKDRANFCDWFRPSPKAFDPAGIAAQSEASSKLSDLFGDSKGSGAGDGGAVPGDQPDDLFRK